MSGYAETFDGPLLENEEPERTLYDPNERVLDLDVEHELRTRRLARLGTLLVVGFCLPVMDFGGKWSFEQFTNFPGWNLMALAQFLPLIVGIATLLGAQLTGPPLRGLLLALLSLTPLLLTLGVPAGTRSDLLGLFKEVPAALVLWVLSSQVLLVANRTRRYRPMRRASYWIGVLGAVGYLTSLCLPVQNQIPVVQMVKEWRQLPVLSIGLGLHLLFMVACCFVTLRNSPLRFSHDAAHRATNASRAWILAAVCIGGTFAAITVTNLFRVVAATEQFEPFLGGLALWLRTAFILTGLGLLLPSAVADLWIGRTYRTSQD